MTSVLRYGQVSTKAGISSNSGSPFFAVHTTNRTGPGENRADALGEVSFRLVATGLFRMPAWPLTAFERVSETIQDLVGPEPLEPVQRLVERRELLVRDAADLLHALYVLLIQRIDDTADLLALCGEANAVPGAGDAPARRFGGGEFDQLLRVLWTVGA